MAFNTAHDIVPDSPTNVFATLNPLDVNSDGLANNINDGNLYANNPDSEYDQTRSTFYLKSGKWYWEVYIAYQVSTTHQFGVVQKDYAGGVGERRMFQNNALKYNSLGSSSYGTSFAQGNVIGIYLNLDVGEITFYINGTSQGVAFTDLLTSIDSVGWTPALIQYNSTAHVNFGQDSSFGGNKTSGSANAQDANGIGSFYYQPPTGALALCTANLPDPDIDPAVDDLPEDYFKAVEYAGDNNTTKTIDSSNGITFVPDLIWVKNRTVAVNNYLIDSVRGAGSGKHLHSNTTDSESTASSYATNGGIASFGSTEGFTVYKGSDATYQGTNISGNNFVAWCFRAGGAPTADNTATSGAMNANGSTATSSNSSVSIDGVLQSNYTPAGLPTIYPKRMSVNTKAGFSIIRYSGNSTSGASIPTGLNSDVDFFIYKAINDGTYGWNSWHRSLTDDHYIALNTTSKEDNSIFVWDTSGMSNNVITHGSWLTGANVTGKDYIIYAWHSVPGYSAFGSYTGNGVADGPFVYTGFKPAWVMVKCSSNGLTNWFVEDSTRNPYNVVNSALFPDTSGQELGSSSTLQYDFLSNGFKVRGIQSAGLNNTSGYTYIFAAFAEMPFKYANAR